MAKRNTKISSALRDVLRTVEYAFIVEEAAGKSRRLHSFESDQNAIELVEALRSAGTFGSTYHRIAITTGELPDALYREFKVFLDRFGGTWDRGRQEHRFHNDPRPFIDTVIETGELPHENPLDFFPTPPALVEAILTGLDGQIGALRARIETGERVRALEPSIGRGGIALPLSRLLGGPSTVLGLELNPRNREAMTKEGFEVELTDFLEWRTTERFPLVIMNPPFDGKLWRKHVLHAWDHLEEHGTLCCIAPASIRHITSESDADFARLVLSHGEVLDNPEDAFAHLGVKLPTVTLTMEKGLIRAHSGYPSWDAAMFDIEEDAPRRKAINALFAPAFASLHDIGAQTARTIPLQLREELAAGLRAIADEALRRDFACYTLTDVDVDFHIDAEITAYCEIKGIVRTRAAGIPVEAGRYRMPADLGAQGEMVLA